MREINDASNQMTSALRATSVKRVCREGEWYFSFENGARLRAGCLWRIIVEGHVVLTECDDAQWFGLKSPVDAGQEAMRILFGKQIEAVEIVEGTADIHIRFAGGSRLELLNDSSGYEPWGFSSKEVELVATAQGDVFPTKTPEK